VEGRSWARGTTTSVKAFAKEALDDDHDAWMLEYCSSADEIFHSLNKNGAELYSKTKLDAALRDVTQMGAPRLQGMSLTAIYSLERRQKCVELAQARLWAMHWALVVPDRPRPERDRGRKKRKRTGGEEEADKLLDEEAWEAFEAKSEARLGHPLHAPPL
jgi:hypothetical protein